MKKKITYGILIVSLLICLAIAVIIVMNHKNDLKNKEKKENDNKRYAEIQENTKKAVEWNIKAMYPNCPITDTFDDVKNANTSRTHHNSSFLISNGYIKKDELLDVDGKNYCDVYVIIQTNFEDPQDYQRNCTTAYKIYLKCNDYEDKGYIDWG